MANKSIYYPIGTIFRDGEAVLEVAEVDYGCDGCYYHNKDCVQLEIPNCSPKDRPDRKSIIYKETRLQPHQNSLESRVAVLEAQINVQNKKIDIVLSQLSESIKTH